MKIYSKNQIGIIIIIIIGIFYSEYLNKKYYETIKSGIVFNSSVIKQNCKNSRRMSSSVTIKENNKEYYVKLDKSECEKFPKYSKIKVYYNKNNDEFIFKVQKFNGKKRTIFLIISLIISFLPWSLWISKVEKKNCR